jgi:hypothetical protein
LGFDYREQQDISFYSQKRPNPTPGSTKPPARIRSSWGQSGRGVKLTAHLNIVSRLRLNGTLPSLLRTPSCSAQDDPVSPVWGSTHRTQLRPWTASVRQANVSTDSTAAPLLGCYVIQQRHTICRGHGVHWLYCLSAKTLHAVIVVYFKMPTPWRNLRKPRKLQWGQQVSQCLTRCNQSRASIGRNVRLITDTLLVLGSRRYSVCRHRHRWVTKLTELFIKLREFWWSSNVHYRLHKSLPLGPTLSHNTQSTSCQCIPLRSALMLSSHQTLGLPNGSLLRTFLLSLVSHACHMLCPSHPSLLDSPMNRCWELRTEKLDMCNFLNSAVISCLVSPDIHLSLCCCPSVTGQHTHCLQQQQFDLSVCSWWYTVTPKAANYLRNSIRS